MLPRDPLHPLRLVDPPLGDADAVHAVTPKTGLTLLSKAVAGNRTAFLILEGINLLAAAVAAAPAASPVRCAGCGKPITDNTFNAAVCIPSTARPDGARVAICRRCGCNAWTIRTIGAVALAGPPPAPGIDHAADQVSP